MTTRGRLLAATAGRVGADVAHLRVRCGAASDAAFAPRGRLPAVFGRVAFARAGCVAASGTALDEVRRRLAVRADRALHGARPADRPVALRARVGLAANVKTTEATGVAIPRSLRLRADEVIA